MGVAYKRDVDDPRESPALKILRILSQKGAKVAYHDPYIPQLRGFRHYPEIDLISEDLTEELLHEQDGVLIVTDHSCVDYQWVVDHAALVVDSRNATAKVIRGREKIILA